MTLYQIKPAFQALQVLVGVSELNDIAQYLWGKSFGRIKVTSTLSPNKTLADSTIE